MSKYSDALYREFVDFMDENDWLKVPKEEALSIVAEVPPLIIGGLERPEITACAICGGVIEGREICRDHSHKTGKFRGWLCSNCNSGLGFFRDDPARLERAV